MNLFVGSSASDYIPKKYFDDCKMFLDELFKYDFDLVFGACNEGIMGLSYSAACSKLKNVIGVYPLVYKCKSNGILCTEIEKKTIGERTDELFNISDVLLFLPGGFGTVYELFAAIEFRRAHEFDKPIIIYNACGYYDKIFEFLELTYDEGFALRDIEKYYYVCDNAKDAINYINNYRDRDNKIRKRIM